MRDPHAPVLLGGRFGLPSENGGEAPPFLDGPARSVLLTNARSGIRLLVDGLRPRHVWLPSYLCASMVCAADNGEADVRFYPMAADLSVRDTAWMGDVERGDLVLLIDYFGFLGDGEIEEKARRRGAFVIEDASQALLSQGVGEYADFTLYSPRKFLGVPDGGVLRIAEGVALDVPNLVSPPTSAWFPGLWATIRRREFDQFGGAKDWFPLFQESEANQPIGAYAMTDVSKALIERAFRYADIRARRAENYRLLAGGLSEIALFPDLPDGVVPLGFPVRVRERDALRSALYAHEIFPPVHWSLDGVVPDGFRESHQLSKQIMTLPCDQRYCAPDMERMIQCVRQEMAC